ncbi:MAG: TonB-dependent receptor [candidate division Zixibacteria bacterium]|nr:TonB-dependent receptor [candidate division Zixibacteria bacterium]
MPLLSLVLILIICNSQAVSGTAGKIAGVVMDRKSGDELPGATIRVVGTQSASKADSDGEYYIINLPVGVYNLSVSMIGYETMIYKDVRVLMDLTTPIDFELTEAPLDMQKSVTVLAQRPLIQRDNTSSGTIITRDEIATLANSGSVNTIISNSSGSVVGQDGGVHIKGGRSGTLSYYFDGFSIQDPFSSGLGMRVVPDALEQLSLTSGGLSPEYGEALAGVVNAITREGRDKYHGRIKVYEGLSHKYDVSNSQFEGLSRTNTHSISADVSGPLMNIGSQRATFFGAFEFIRNGGYLPHNRSRSYSGVGKVVIFPASRLKVSINGSYFFSDAQRYRHRDNNGFSYDFNLDGLGKFEDEAYLIGIRADYNKSSNTVYSMAANHFRTKTKFAPESIFDLYWKQWPGYSEDANGVYNGTIHEDNYQAGDDYLGYRFTQDDDFYPVYQEQFSAYSGLKMSLVSQINKHHQIKVGGDVRHYELHWDSRQFFNIQPYGETYTAFPWFGAAYVQDKIEHNDLVVNIGGRVDYLYSDIAYWNNPITHDYRRNSSPKVEISPRLGISHPISEKSVLHFNYGYLFQAPQSSILYTNLNGELDSGFPLFGNPDLESEKTIYYELGLTHMLGDNLRVQLTTYYRDIRNMIGAREVVEGGNRYTIFENSDFGSAKGLDFVLESVRRRNLNWSLQYSYMIARGNASDPYEWYYDYFTVAEDIRPQIPNREFPLAYDLRHSITAVLDYRVARFDKRKIVGITLPDAWGINMLTRYGSGLAYTRLGKDGRRMGTVNGERMPYTLRMDMRFNKDLYLFKGDNFMSFFVEVINLFDRRNVRRVYSVTGKPDDDGFEVQNITSSTYEQSVYLTDLLEKNPQHYEAPRRVRVGLEFNF